VERELLLLGLLRDQDMHGYQINERLRDLLGDSVRLKKATIYRLLAGLEERGWVSTCEEQEHNRPARRVYAITREGEAQFEQMLRRSLPGYKGLDLLGAADELFLDALPQREVAGLLRQRRSKVESRLVATYSQEHQGSSAILTCRHHRRLLQAELVWLDDLIGEVTTGAATTGLPRGEPPEDVFARAGSSLDPEAGHREPAPDEPGPEASELTERKRKPIARSAWRPEFD